MDSKTAEIKFLLSSLKQYTNDAMQYLLDENESLLNITLEKRQQVMCAIDKIMETVDDSNSVSENTNNANNVNDLTNQNKEIFDQIIHLDKELNILAKNKMNIIKDELKSINTKRILNNYTKEPVTKTKMVDILN